jgi:hypothetical protein
MNIFIKDWMNMFGLGDEVNEKLSELLNIFCMTFTIRGAHIILIGILNAIG